MSRLSWVSGTFWLTALATAPACDSGECDAVGECASYTHWDRKACDCVPDHDPMSCFREVSFPQLNSTKIACVGAQAYLTCGSCSCLSTDGSTCPECAAPCTNACTVEEYGASCGGPRRDGGVYARAPISCREVAQLPSGATISCCPCAYRFD